MNSDKSSVATVFLILQFIVPLEFHHFLLSVILHHDAVCLRVVTLWRLLAAEYHGEGTLLQHAWETTLTVTDGQCLVCVVVAQLYVGVTSGLVTIVRAFVFI